jgi:hypothetical protein
LELGGKNPCIIDETANLKLAAKELFRENSLMQDKPALLRLYHDSERHEK